MQQLDTTPRCHIQLYLKDAKQIVIGSVQAMKIKLSLSNLLDLKSLIYSVVKPKLGSLFSPKGIIAFVSLILEAFLSSITSISYPDIKIVKYLGPSISDSHFYNGLLIPHRKMKECSAIKIALFSCSIPQELEALEGETVHFINHDTTLEKQFVEQTKKSLELFLNKCPIKMICSQKTIHREIISFLQLKGVQCIERLSLIYSKELADLSSTVLLPSLNVFECGGLEKVANVLIGDQSYLQFEPEVDSHYGTIALCCQVIM